MDADAFRQLALSRPEAEEGGHQGHADFRIGGKIFATLGPDETWAMVKLPPDRQALVVEGQPDVFEPSPGAWGRQGCTRVELEAADPTLVEDLLDAAWERIATPTMRRKHGRDGG